MQRMRAATVLLASMGLVVATAAPVTAEPLPATLTIETTVSHYLGGWWEQQIGFTIGCEGFEPVEAWVDLPGTNADVLASLGPVPAGTICWAEVSSWPDPGWSAGWDETWWDPAPPFVLGEGENVLSVVQPRVWMAEWPPQDDRWQEYDLALTIDRVYLNGKGGIEVEGTSWCPEAAGPLAGTFDGVYANAQWFAHQNVGRKTQLQASYDSAIAHPCFEMGDPEHGPYAWQTRYPYPDGGLQFVYAWNGKFGGGTIEVEATAQTELQTVVQDFAPEGWTSYDGMFVPYDPDCEDNTGDGWCVSHYFWAGWDQASLRPIKVR